MPRQSICPICEKSISRTMLMCKPHWFQVPRELRDRVWSTYRAYRSDDGSLLDYVEARDAAIHAVEVQV